MGWPDNKPDAEWIAECGSFRWVVISGDKAIERVPEERQAVINGRCKVFMFEDSHTTRTEDWAASFIVARERIAEIVNKGNGPLFVTVRPCKVRGHIGMPRFIEKAGGGWRSPEQTPEQPAPPPAAELRDANPRQPNLFDSILAKGIIQNR